MGVVLPKEGFLESLREVTKKDGALLIFDEVITGFRLGLSGAQGYYHVEPDMTTFGKIIGGGMPLAAYGGRKDIMNVVAPLGSVYQAGTLSGNPIATTAGIETLRILMEDPGIYERLNEKGKKLAQAMRATGDSVQVNQVGSLMSVFFTQQPVIDYDSVMTSDTKRYAAYFSYLLDHGIYTAPSQYEAMFISDAHTPEDLEETIVKMREGEKATK